MESSTREVDDKSEAYSLVGSQQGYRREQEG